MADEAVIVESEGGTQDFTVAVGTTIEKMTLCKLADPRTASASDGANVFAGIAATEKNSTDNATELGLFTEGTFVLTAAPGAAITAGMAVSLSGANLIKQATEAEMVTGAAFGKALESIASATTGEVKLGFV
tara:strand:+ start:1915 stop:2310 length:396 start_codon:yes stop_codon:yes gene_type:complete